MTKNELTKEIMRHRQMLRETINDFMRETDVELAKELMSEIKDLSKIITYLEKRELGLAS